MKWHDIKEKLVAFSNIAWTASLLLSALSLGVSCVALSYVISNYGLQKNAREASLYIQDVKLISPYEKPFIRFNLANRGTVDPKKVSIFLRSMNLDGSARRDLRKRFDLSFSGGAAPRTYEAKDIDLSLYTGLLVVCVSYIRDKQSITAPGFYTFTGFNPQLNVQNGGGGEYQADVVEDIGIKSACAGAS